MAIRLQAPPGISDIKNFRSREAFDKAIEDFGKYVGSTTVYVGSIAAGGVGTVSVMVTGARADRGMIPLVGLPSAFNTGLTPWANITADDTVTIYLRNSTGSAIDPPLATYYVWVRP